jgi:acetoin:2,6-dichlorophenolindophenol oxidoreductase subunit alpha
MAQNTNDQHGDLSPAKIDQTLLLNLYQTMVCIRVTEEKIAELLQANQIRCPTHLYTGQEAIAAGVCAALAQEDYIFGGHRSHGHYLAKGGNLCALMAELFGRVTGCARGRGGSMHLIAPEVGLLGTVPLVSATIPIAVGAGLASKLRKDGRVSVAFFGDGATEEGHFHESLNMAALYHLPVIFVCENNSYSSHMPIVDRRAEDNIYKSGEAHGIPGIRVDGNDVVLVYSAAKEATLRARTGLGPTLLECRTYRWRGHVGPALDMDVGVKRKDEMKEWLPKDPLARARVSLLQIGIAESEFERIERQVLSEVARAVEFAVRSPHPPESELLDEVFVAQERTN